MKIITAKEVAFSNDLGGTELMTGPVKVAVQSSWHDEETGTHYRGQLFRLEDIERARAKGKTGYTPADMLKYPGVHDRVLRASKAYDPTAVCVSEFDVVDIVDGE
jgi:hypothetical protein